MSTRAPLVVFALTLAACASVHELDDVARPAERASSASLAIDEHGLYWVDAARAAVVHAPLGGGPGVVLASAHPSLYAPIALGATDVVWGDRDAGHVRVMRAPRDGGAAAIIAEGNGGPIGIGVGRGHVYFSRESDTFDLLEVDLTTAHERVIATNLPALGIVVDGGDLLVTRCANGGLARIPMDGRVPTLIAPTYCPITLALDGGDLFFTDYAVPTMPGAGGLGVFTVSARGGVARRVTLSDGIVFAIHGGAVYTVLGGAIVRVTRDGASSTRIAAARDVRGIAVDDALVYWTEPSPDGTLELMFAPNGE